MLSLAARKKESPPLRRTPMLKPPDKIISSDYVHYKHMIPSYIKEKPNMYLLLGMDYGRQWQEERCIYERNLFDDKAIIEYLPRKYVKRDLNRKKKNVVKCH